MPFLPPGFGFEKLEESASWPRRIIENFRAALAMQLGQAGFVSSAPPAFSFVNTSTRYSFAQSLSVLGHVAILGGLLFLLAAHPLKIPESHLTPLGSHAGPLLFPPAELQPGKPSIGHRGGSGSDEPDPARNGLLAPPSFMPLVPPRITHTDHVEMPVAPAVFDPNAPSAVPVISHLGLPWMNQDTNSAGPGKGHGIGSHDGNGMGDDSGNGAGAGDDDGNYANVVSSAACLFCPEPPYTDEARRAKLQGTVTLRVLIGADGRAKRIQIMKGMGLGLDERALEAVRAWHFTPARDAQHQAISTWVTIETRFQLL